VSAVILALGGLLVLAVMFSPARRREQAAGELAAGDDSTQVLAHLGPTPTRCPAGGLEHLGDGFAGEVPRRTRETALERMRALTAARWLYPGRAGCTPEGGDAEVGLGSDGRVLWIVPATGRIPVVFSDSLAS